MFYSVHRNIA